MNWGTLLAVLLGGAVTVGAQGVQTYWANRGEVRRRSDEACEQLRGVVAELRREAADEHDPEVSDALDERMEQEYLPRFHTSTGYLARRAVRVEMEELARWLERWVPIRNNGGFMPRRARWLILFRMDELLSAYRRHDLRLPKQHSWQAEMRAVIAEDDDLARQQAEYNSPGARRARLAAREEP